MSEETQSDGTWSGLKKTVIGTLTTVVTGGGIWLSTTLFGGHSEDKEEHKTEVAAPAAAPVVINLTQNQENTQQQKAGGATTIIKEKVVEKPVEKKAKKSETEEFLTFDHFRKQLDRIETDLIHIKQQGDKIMGALDDRTAAIVAAVALVGANAWAVQVRRC